MKNEEINLCKRLVQDLHIKLVMINIMGEEKVYYPEGFVLPDSHGFYGEIQNGKDITKVIQSGQFNFHQGRITQDRFDELTQSIVKESFYFGTRDFLVLTSVRENL